MATILKVPAILLPSARLRSYSPENPKSIVNFSSFKQRFSGPFQFSLSYLPSKRTFLPGKFAPFASSGETTGTQEIDEEVKAEEYSEEAAEDEASIDENAPGEETTASAVLAALQSYKQALANNDQSTIAEIESFLQSIEDEKNSLANKLNALSADMATERDRVLRISADFDNFRKRTERERLSLLSNAQGEVLESLLPVLDNFERAKSQIKVETEGEEKINNSYQSIYKQFLELLNSLGVKAVETVGTAFDPLEMKTLATFISSEAQSNIFLNSLYLGKYKGDVKREFTGIIYHEIARVRQWDGNQEAPIGLLTGIADFFRLKAGYESVYWSRVGSGNYWDEGYDVTARFLEYCDDRYYGVVVYLNGWMRYEYKEEYFKDFTGKTADELWNEYKLYYATRG